MQVDVKDIRKLIDTLKVGDRVLLSGTVYTARDAAHKRIIQLIEQDKDLPFPICDSVIYYCGPTPTSKGYVIGSAGPTTSMRMEPYIPKLLDLGLAGIIGKGPLSEKVKRKIVENKAVYFCAIGGAGAFYSNCIEKCTEIAFFDLGPESIKRLVLKDFPVYVGIDFTGNTLFV
ncbi:MAG: TRZ/ATZ family protein [Ruminococcaceae bacterium]|nr:TRZ/ATZ family protein [Oscillospiraceae bacterium]